MKKGIKRLSYKIIYGLDKVLSALLFFNSKNAKFVIVSEGRAGSNLLINLINQNSEIACYNELYHPSEVGAGPENRHTVNSNRLYLIFRRFMPTTFLKVVFLKKRNYKSVGFKYILSQSKFIRESVLFDEDIQKVILTRKNILRGEVSRQIAWKTNHWFSYKDSKDCESISFDIKKFFENRDRWNKLVDELKNGLEERGQAYINIYFEDLISEKQQTILNDIYDHIGVSRLKVDPKTIKTKRQNPYGLKDIVENYDELEKALVGTEIEWMLYSD